jgi:restriction-modification enzyme MmeI-like protein
LNAVEIEEAISQLAEQPFDPVNFPYAFLEAFGNKETTIKRLRAGASNKSDLGGVLQTNNIHIKVCAEGEVTKTLAALRESPSTTRAKAKFILATDGQTLEAENLASDDVPVACAYKDFPDHFGFFLPLAGISTVRQISENSFDIRATSRLNRLYVELLKDNPEWGTTARRHDMNHLMARLIFCFFAEDTDIFIGRGLFTDTIAQMSAKDSSNTHQVIETLFRAMNTKVGDRDHEGLPRWSHSFPYVNGGLFSGSMDVPRFSKIARSYLLHIGNLDWTKINPDIFGSMIQAVAEDEERGALGMHYTSVPNILKVLNPLSLTTCARSSPRRATIRAPCSTFASAWRRSGSLTRLVAPAIFSLSHTRLCGRSRPTSTSGAASRRTSPSSGTATCVRRDSLKPSPRAASLASSLGISSRSPSYLQGRRTCRPFPLR